MSIWISYAHDICQESWWYNLLYINNVDLKPDLSNMCMGATWYLAVDMQMFLIAPLVIWPLWKFPKIGLGIAGALTTAGKFCLDWHTQFHTHNHIFSATGVALGLAWAEDYPPTMGVQGLETENNYFRYYYVMPWCRYQPYILGMLLGFWLYKSRNMRKLKFNTIVICWIWVSQHYIYGSFILIW